MSFPPAEHGRWKMRVRRSCGGVLPGRSQLLRVHTAPHKQEHPA